ncbi:MAG: SEC-C metal-binding domain-containing protein, partial [Candidatus Azambacteria bacterium]|nr:SEC-C metal-binding domain-containing protein [Candidatus Azambacteria bacterium]
ALGKEVFLDGVRKLALQTMDMLWMEHLEAMDYMRGSVNLRAYGQRDPLVEYKREGLRLFRDMQESTKAHFIELLPNIGVGAFAHEEQKLKEVHENARLIGDVARPADNASAGTIKREGEKVGRNDPCPCGSGKKFKKCHGATTQE